MKQLLPVSAILFTSLISLIGFSQACLAEVADSVPFPATGISAGTLLDRTVSPGVEILTDATGHTLYSFDPDAPGVSNCKGGCAVAWPPALTTAATLAAPLSIVIRANGAHQIAFNGKPLYTYADDASVGDTTGDGVGGVWHLVHAH